ncbi:sulfite oxidase [Glycomyces albus]
MSDRIPPQPAPRAWAAAGAAAALTGLAVSHLVAALTEPRSAPLSAVADVVIAASPPPVTEWAIQTFGTADKPLLQFGIVAVLAAVGAVCGLLWRRNRWAGLAVIGLFAAVGAASAATREALGAAAIVPALIAAAVAAAILFWWSGPVTETGPSGRRRFLAAAAGVAAAAAAGSVLARRLIPGQVEEDRAALTLPDPDQAAPPAGEVDFDERGLASWHTDNDQFYRIDTAITSPQVEIDTWRLRVHGMVGRARTYTFDDLLGRELIERDITLCCVSNPIGGELIGNARWLGISLADLLAESEPDPEADQLVSRSHDGWTAGSPVDMVFDGRDALIAIGMNGSPPGRPRLARPIDHPRPLRVRLGHQMAHRTRTDPLQRLRPLLDPARLVRARTDQDRRPHRHPRSNASAGTVTVAGVAWAQHRGISAVHLRVDDGEWRECELAEAPSTDTWRQWRLEWEAETGDHTLTVRATDGDGVPQTSEVTGVKPSGATGLHNVKITVA